MPPRKRAPKKPAGEPGKQARETGFRGRPLLTPEELSESGRRAVRTKKAVAEKRRRAAPLLKWRELFEDARSSKKLGRGDYAFQGHQFLSNFLGNQPGLMAAWDSLPAFQRERLALVVGRRIVKSSTKSVMLSKRVGVLLGEPSPGEAPFTRKEFNWFFVDPDRLAELFTAPGIEPLLGRLGHQTRRLAARKPPLNLREEHARLLSSMKGRKDLAGLYPVASLWLRQARKNGLNPQRIRHRLGLLEKWRTGIQDGLTLLSPDALREFLDFEGTPSLKTILDVVAKHGSAKSMTIGRAFFSLYGLAFPGNFPEDLTARVCDFAGEKFHGLGSRERSELLARTRKLVEVVVRLRAKGKTVFPNTAFKTFVEGMRGWEKKIEDDVTSYRPTDHARRQKPPRSIPLRGNVDPFNALRLSGLLSSAQVQKIYDWRRSGKLTAEQVFDAIDASQNLNLTGKGALNIVGTDSEVIEGRARGKGKGALVSRRRVHGIRGAKQKPGGRNVVVGRPVPSKPAINALFFRLKRAAEGKH